MASFDRTRIIDLLKPHFPQIEGMTGKEVQDFLNQQTGLNVTSDTPNGTAFDAWRQALAKEKPELWPYNAEHVSRIKERTGKMLEEEAERLSK